ncbi:9701_t:CDS:1 [Paraglomus brasilianum]|uniref:9701_t:CDS:1 n=1 Tax=Paraglomus brasilianum TaxID=144538 RepID=A0A9N9A2Q6_9GLOM|nr:9701_t:CDS:1 [Paraglomus brasilianum]
MVRWFLLETEHMSCLIKYYYPVLLGELQEISKSDDYLAEEFDILQESELQPHHFKLNRGVEAAFRNGWNAGCDYGPEFARAFASKVLISNQSSQVGKKNLILMLSF